MAKLVGWLAATLLLALLIWQTVAADPLLPPAAAALLLVVVAGLAGLRLGADSAAAYTRDLQRLNKVLAEQNQQLQEVNAMLLKQAQTDATKSNSAAD